MRNVACDRQIQCTQQFRLHSGPSASADHMELIVEPNPNSNLKPNPNSNPKPNPDSNSKPNPNSNPKPNPNLNLRRLRHLPAIAPPLGYCATPQTVRELHGSEGMWRMWGIWRMWGMWGM
jgi:hypothetical protein